MCFALTGCKAIAQSRYTTLVGVPVALVGVIGFFALSLLSFASLSELQLRRFDILKIHHGLAFIGLLFSGTLTLLGYFETSSFCVWCMIALLAIAGTERLSASNLRKKYSPSSNLSLVCVMMVSLSGLAIAYLVTNLRMESERVQVSSVQLSRFSTSQLLGSGAEHVAGRRFVGFYVPGCGSCVQSLRTALLLGTNERNVSLTRRFVCLHEAELTFTAYLQAVNNSKQGLEMVVKFFNTSSALTVSNLSKFLQDQKFSEPNPQQISDAKLQVVQNTRMVKDLQIFGFPVVIKVTEHHANEVNPITFVDFTKEGED